jgi:hypothetical protein
MSHNTKMDAGTTQEQHRNTRNETWQLKKIKVRLGDDEGN